MSIQSSLLKHHNEKGDNMKLIVFVIFMPAVFFLTHDYSSSFRQKENVVILKGQIIRYRRISEAEMADAEKMLQVIEYKVVHVYKGTYDGEKIKVAHHVSTARNVEIGDEICLKVKKSKELIELYKNLRDSGVDVPEDSEAEYVSINDKKENACQEN